MAAASGAAGPYSGPVPEQGAPASHHLYPVEGERLARRGSRGSFPVPSQKRGDAADAHEQARHAAILAPSRAGVARRTPAQGRENHRPGHPRARRQDRQQALPQGNGGGSRQSWREQAEGRRDRSRAALHLRGYREAAGEDACGPFRKHRGGAARARAQRRGRRLEGLHLIVGAVANAQKSSSRISPPRGSSAPRRSRTPAARSRIRRCNLPTRASSVSPSPRRRSRCTCKTNPRRRKP